ncbi:MAG: hypothetical protein LBT96_03235 [Campylobacteraceae bacterium]|jgi:hypothetical protein|nr:hypothetical protein [Campylobacteraceae bacterium]
MRAINPIYKKYFNFYSYNPFRTIYREFAQKDKNSGNVRLQTCRKIWRENAVTLRHFGNYTRKASIDAKDTTVTHTNSCFLTMASVDGGNFCVANC